MKQEKPRAREILQDWPNWFYTPPEFPTVPGFDNLELDIVQAKPDPAQARLPGRVGCMIATWRHELFVFQGGRYKLLNVSEATNSVAQDVRPISQSELGYLGNNELFNSTGVDVVFPNPLRNSEDAHFFCGETYLSVPPGSTTLSRGPVKIVDMWTCLKEAKFTTIDAALEIPGVPNYAWFFSGTQYIGAEWKRNGSGIQSSKFIGPAPIVDGFKALGAVGFDRIDMIIPNVKARNQVWIFSGGQYVLLSIDPSDGYNKVLDGPKLIRNGWPSLVGFYVQ